MPGQRKGKQKRKTASKSPGNNAATIRNKNPQYAHALRKSTMDGKKQGNVPQTWELSTEPALSATQKPAIDPCSKLDLA